MTLAHDVQRVMACQVDVNWRSKRHRERRAVHRAEVQWPSAKNLETFRTGCQNTNTKHITSERIIDMNRERTSTCMIIHREFSLLPGHITKQEVYLMPSLYPWLSANPRQ